MPATPVTPIKKEPKKSALQTARRSAVRKKSALKGAKKSAVLKVKKIKLSKPKKPSHLQNESRPVKGWLSLFGDPLMVEIVVSGFF